MALAVTQQWRWIFGFPAAVSLLLFLHLLCVIRNESPKFYLMKNDEDRAIDSIAKIYQTNSGEESEAISTYLKSTMQKETSRVSFCEAFCTN